MKIQAILQKKATVTVDGSKVALKNAPINYNGTIYLPVAEMGKVFNAGVEWNNATQTVKLTTNQNAKLPVQAATAIPTPASTSIPAPTFVPVSIPTATPIPTRVFYRESDVNAKYPVVTKGHDSSYKLIFTYEGKEYHILKLGGVSKDQVVYLEDKYYLNYLTAEQLSQFQKYTFDFETKTATPIHE